MMDVINTTTDRYNEELRDLTGGEVPEATKAERLRTWLAGQGLDLPNMKAETVEAKIKDPDTPKELRRALQIRATIGSAAVKKLPSFVLMASPEDSRVRGLFNYGRARSGRWTGADIQPHNFPKSGPSMVKCSVCGLVLPKHSSGFHQCGGELTETDWSAEAMEDGIRDLSTRDVNYILARWGDPVELVSGCLRGIFTAAEGKELIGSDYSAIEAVGLACLAGEEWRINVFKGDGKIYEESASRVFRVPRTEMDAYKARTQSHHPIRAKGKIAELASGYQGWVNAWLKFGAGDYMTEEEIKLAVMQWRNDSPAIVELWRQMEQNAIAAVLNPYTWFEYRGIKHYYEGQTLYCFLPSGRSLKYHRPTVRQEMAFNKPKLNLYFWGWNTNPDNGTPQAWIEMAMYGGRWVENIGQAACRDILAWAMVRLEPKGYPVVLHVHDEAVAEVPLGSGSVEVFEQILEDRPHFARDWPIKATDGWIGHRYRKG
jgi:DNA polymerase